MTYILSYQGIGELTNIGLKFTQRNALMQCCSVSANRHKEPEEACKIFQKVEQRNGSQNK